MKEDQLSPQQTPADYEESIERVGYDFGVSRRSFVQFLGAGLMVAASVSPALAQRQGGRGGGRGARTVAARLHFAKDGTITLLAAKVEAGPGARPQLPLPAPPALPAPPTEPPLKPP